MALVVTQEARDIGRSILGIRDIRKLERAGLRLVIVEQPVLRVRPRRKARLRWLAFVLVMMALVVVYAAKLGIATADFLRS